MNVFTEGCTCRIVGAAQCFDRMGYSGVKHLCICAVSTICYGDHECICKFNFLNRRGTSCRAINHQCICKFSPRDCLSVSCNCICKLTSHSMTVRELCRSLEHLCICSQPHLGKCKLIPQISGHHTCICSYPDIHVNCRAPQMKHSCICMNVELQLKYERCRAIDHDCSCILCPSQCISKSHKCICTVYNTNRRESLCRISNDLNHTCICESRGPNYCLLSAGHTREFFLKKIRPWESDMDGMHMYVSSYLHPDLYDSLPTSDKMRVNKIGYVMYLAVPPCMTYVVHERLRRFMV